MQRSREGSNFGQARCSFCISAHLYFSNWRTQVVLPFWRSLHLHSASDCCSDQSSLILSIHLKSDELFLNISYLYQVSFRFLWADCWTLREKRACSSRKSRLEETKSKRKLIIPTFRVLIFDPSKINEVLEKFAERTWFPSRCKNCKLFVFDNNPRGSRVSKLSWR